MLRVALIGGTGMGDLLDGEFTEVATPLWLRFPDRTGRSVFSKPPWQGDISFRPTKSTTGPISGPCARLACRLPSLPSLWGASDRVCQWVRLWCWTIFWTSTTARPKTFFDDKVQHLTLTRANVQPPGAGRAFGSRRGFRNNAGSQGLLCMHRRPPL